MNARPEVALPVQASGLTTALGGRIVLDDVSFVLPAGAGLAVLGPNGSGKSTLLRTLMGMLPGQGTMTFGTTRFDASGARLRSARRRAHLMAFVSQEEAPAAELTVVEAVSLGRTPHRKPWASHDPGEHQAVESAMVAVGMAEHAGRSCSSLSGGQRHRVVLARALAQQTPVILLDEPTNHLDPVWRHRLLNTLHESGRTVIWSMHELDLAVQHADLVAVLDQGRLKAFGPPREVLTARTVREVFGVESTIVPRTTGESDDAAPHHLLTWSPQNQSDLR